MVVDALTLSVATPLRLPAHPEVIAERKLEPWTPDQTVPEPVPQSSADAADSAARYLSSTSNDQNLWMVLGGVT